MNTDYFFYRVEFKDIMCLYIHINSIYESFFSKN